MTDFLDHIAFVCLSGAVIGTILMLWFGLWNLIDRISHGKVMETILKIFSE